MPPELVDKRTLKAQRSLPMPAYAVNVMGHLALALV